MEPQRKRQRYTAEPVIIDLVDCHEIKANIPIALHNATFTIDDDNNNDDALSQSFTIIDLNDTSENELPVPSPSKTQDKKDKSQKSVHVFLENTETS